MASSDTSVPRILSTAGTEPAPGDGPSTGGRAYRRDIDGLRAVAITSVVFYHLFPGSLLGGFVGVDIFFVISGYLIGAHIYGEMSRNNFSFVRFYHRRAKRILPALLAVILFCYVIALPLDSPLELTRLGTYAIAPILLYANTQAYHRANNYFAPGVYRNPLSMTWSLSVEEQFYIGLPILLLLLTVIARRCSFQRAEARKLFFRTVFAIAVLSFLICLWATFHDHVGAFYLVPARAWELAIGVLMALHEADPARQPEARYFGGGRIAANARAWLGIIFILYAIVRVGPATLFPGPLALLPALGAALIISSPVAFLNKRILALAPLVYIGLISYSWYLWHWPLISFVTLFSVRPLEHGIRAAILLVSLVAAWLSYRFIEQPFRRSRTPSAKLLLRYALACGLVALPALWMLHTNGIPGRYPAVAAAKDAELPTRTIDCFALDSSLDRPDCRPDGRRSIAIWGDSHAFALTPVMSDLASSANIRLLSISKHACPPVLADDQTMREIYLAPHCLDSNMETLKFLIADKSITTVVLVGYWSGYLYLVPGYPASDLHYTEQAEERRPPLQSALHNAVRALQSAGKRVVLVQDVPWFKFNPVDQRITSYIPLRRWVVTHLFRQDVVPFATTNQIFVARDAKGAALVAQEALQDRVEVFDASKQLCTADGCAIMSNGHLLYIDQHHLSDAGASIALQGFPLNSVFTASQTASH